MPIPLTPTSLPSGIYEAQGESLINQIMATAASRQYSSTTETKDRADFIAYQEAMNRAMTDGSLKGLGISLLLGMFLKTTPLAFLTPMLNVAFPILGAKSQMNNVEGPSVFPNAGKSARESLDAAALGKGLQYGMYANQLGKIFGTTEKWAGLLPKKMTDETFATLLEQVNGNLIEAGKDVLSESQEELFRAFLNKGGGEGANFMIEELASPDVVGVDGSPTTLEGAFDPSLRVSSPDLVPEYQPVDIGGLMEKSASAIAEGPDMFATGPGNALDNAMSQMNQMANEGTLLIGGELNQEMKDIMMGLSEEDLEEIMLYFETQIRGY